MANTHETLTSLFTDIANAIREKTGESASIVADNFATSIANIPKGAEVVFGICTGSNSSTLSIPAIADKENVIIFFYALAYSGFTLHSSGNNMPLSVCYMPNSYSVNWFSYYQASDKTIQASTVTKDGADITLSGKTWPGWHYMYFAW